MSNRSIRDERQNVTGRAGAPGRGSLFGKKAAPENKSTVEQVRESMLERSPGIKTRRQRIDEATNY